jgi:ATP-dependent Clp protease ATP-binding subunit ClpA
MISQQLEVHLNKAIRKANEKKHEFLTLENVLLQILDDDLVHQVVEECGADVDDLKDELEDFVDNDANFSILSDEEVQELNQKQFADDQMREIARKSGIYYQPEISVTLQRVIQRSALHVQSSGKKNINAINLLVSLFSEKESHAGYFLKKHGVNRINVVEKIAHTHEKPLTDDGTKPEPMKDPLKKEDKYEKALKDFTVNLNKLAKDGKLDPIIGRTDELKRLVQILSRRTKNNPILVGDSGVGKTALAEGLAQMIVEDNVPENIQGATIYSLDMASLLAGTKFRGDFEERLKIVVEALQKKNEDQGSILFIDEIHTIIGAGSTSGGSLDASNLLKPALSKGKIRCMGSTTFEEYRKFFEKDAALNRRFQKVDIKEPSKDDTIQILEGLKGKYEAHHDVTYSKEIVEAAVNLSVKHISDKKLPDKAIDVMDEVGAYIRMKPEKERNKEVSISDIEAVVAQIARIPQKSISANEKDKLKNLQRDLKFLLYGQDEAVEKVSNAIIMSRSGLGHTDKPIASFLFTGPTGVGKTELAKQLANVMGIHFKRVDMSEYMEKHSVAKLIGAPPGYVGFEQGGVLTEEVNQNPYTVLLLDEIEKAHPDVFNILLQVMDHGALTDSNGRTTDFRNVVLIMTSNAGAKEMESGSIGLGRRKSDIDTTKRDAAIKNYFSPEFRNRLDSIVNFNKLGEENIKRIVSKFMMELENQLAEKNIEIELDDSAVTYLANEGFDDKLGARPLARIVDEKIKKPLANEVLFGKLEKGGKVKIGYKKGEITFKFSK